MFYSTHICRFVALSLGLFALSAMATPVDPHLQPWHTTAEDSLRVQAQKEASGLFFTRIRIIGKVVNKVHSGHGKVYAKAVRFMATFQKAETGEWFEVIGELGGKAKLEKLIKMLASHLDDFEKGGKAILNIRILKVVKFTPIVGAVVKFGPTTLSAVDHARKGEWLSTVVDVASLEPTNMVSITKLVWDGLQVSRLYDEALFQFTNVINQSYARNLAAVPGLEVTPNFPKRDALPADFRRIMRMNQAVAISYVIPPFKLAD